MFDTTVPINEKESQMQRNIYLYGAAADQFTDQVIEKDVDTMFDLIQAIKSDYPEFRPYLKQNPLHYVILTDDNRQNPRKVNFDFEASEFGDATEIHILPEHSGSGTAIVTWAAGSAFAATAAGAVIGFVVNMAISMVVSAIIQSLSPTEKANAKEHDVQQQPSFLFNGAQNVTEQGFPVPVIYGIHMTGSVVIGSGVSVEQLLVTPAQSAPPANGGGGIQPASPLAMPWQWASGS